MCQERKLAGLLLHKSYKIRAVASQDRDSHLKVGNKWITSKFRRKDLQMLVFWGRANDPFFWHTKFDYVWFTSAHFRSCHMAFAGIFSVSMQRFEMVSWSHGQTYKILQTSSLFASLVWADDILYLTWHCLHQPAKHNSTATAAVANADRITQPAGCCTWLCTFLSNPFPSQARPNQGSTLS